MYCYTESVHSVSKLNEILWVYVNFDDFVSEVKFAVLIQDLEFWNTNERAPRASRYHNVQNKNKKQFVSVKEM